MVLVVIPCHMDLLSAFVHHVLSLSYPSIAEILSPLQDGEGINQLYISILQIIIIIISRDNINFVILATDIGCMETSIFHKVLVI